MSPRAENHAKRHKTEDLSQQPAAMKEVFDMFNDDKDIWSPDFQGDFRDAFTSRRATNTIGDGKAVISCPEGGFPVAQIFDVFQPHFISRLKQEVLELEYFEKNNDLYAFLQSEDLSLTLPPLLRSLRTVLSGEKFVSALAAMTGVDLVDGQLHLAAQRYQDTGYLACHDDEITNGEHVRRIAFILYLVPESWSAAEGGFLEIFSAVNDLPDKVVGRVLPRWNSLAFFEVTPCSYHSVSEVLTSDAERVSLTGWFYGKPVHLDRVVSKDVAETVMYKPLAASSNAVLETWFSSEYTLTSNLELMSENFVDESFILLRGFLKQEKFEAITKAWNESGRKQVGPATIRKFSRITAAESILAEFLDMLASAQFVSWLERLTCLKLTGFSCDLVEFQQGDYTLMHDGLKTESHLDVTFGCSDTAWSEEFGGGVNYVCEDEHLLTMICEGNDLAVVMRDEGVMSFVKRINHRAPSVGMRVAMAKYAIQ